MTRKKQKSPPKGYNKDMGDKAARWDWVFLGLMTLVVSFVLYIGLSQGEPILPELAQALQSELVWAILISTFSAFAIVAIVAFFAALIANLFAILLIKFKRGSAKL